MSTITLAPLDETITIAELTRDPYPIYQRLRRESARSAREICRPHVCHQMGSYQGSEG